MTKKEELIEYWQKSTASDLVVAEHLFEKEDYHYCLFIAHLVLEKSLKALYVKNIDTTTPYKHSLPPAGSKKRLDLICRSRIVS